MADNKDITTRFKLDISDFKKNITDANNQIKLANSEFRAASNGTKEWASSVDGISAKIKNLKAILTEQNNKLNAYKSQLQTAQKYEQESKEKVESLRKELEKAKKEYGENSDEVKKLDQELLEAEKEEQKMANQVQRLTITMNNQQGTVNRTETELNELESELNQVEDAEKDAANSANKLDNELENIDDSTNKSNDGFTVFKSTIADLASNVISTAIDYLKDFVREIINVGREFDEQMSKVQAISGATGKDFTDLRDKAKDMGSKTKFTAKQAGEAFEYMAMAGWKTNDMLEGIEGVMSLAAASGEDLGTTSDIVTDSLTALGLSAKDAAHFSDVLATASTNSNTNVALMGETFKYVAPVAGSYGYTLEDVAWATGLLANNGIKGTQAGTSLRSIMSRLATDAGASSKQLGALGVLTKKLGVEFYTSDGKMRSFKDVMDDTRVAFSKLDPKEQAFVSKKIAGQNAMSGFLAIMNSTTKDCEKLGKAIENSDGSAEKMAKTMQDNLNGDMTVFNSTLEGLQTTLYDKFSPALRSVTQYLQGLVSTLNDYFKNAKFSSSETDNLIKSFEELKPIVDVLKIAIGMQFKIALNTTINNFKILITYISGTVNTITGFFKSLYTTIALIFATIGDVLAGDFSKAWNKIKNIASTWATFFGQVWENIKRVFLAFGSWLSGYFSPIFNAIKISFNSVATFFSQKITMIKNSWSSALNNIKRIALIIWGSVTSIINSVFNNIVKTFNKTISFFRSVFSGAVSAIKIVFSPIVGFFGGIWSKIKSKFSGIGTKIGDAIGGAFKASMNGVLVIIEGAINNAISLINGAIKLINKIPGVSVGSVNSISLPRLEQGGILKKGQIGLLEGNGSEAVIPLDKNKKWIDALSKSILKNTNSSNSVFQNSRLNGNEYIFNQTINSPKSLSRWEIYKDTKRQIDLMKMVINGNA